MYIPSREHVETHQAKIREESKDDKWYRFDISLTLALVILLAILAGGVSASVLGRAVVTSILTMCATWTMLEIVFRLIRRVRTRLSDALGGTWEHPEFEESGRYHPKHSSNRITEEL